MGYVGLTVVIVADGIIARNPLGLFESTRLTGLHLECLPGDKVVGAGQYVAPTGGTTDGTGAR